MQTLCENPERDVLSTEQASPPREAAEMLCDMPEG